MKDILEGVKEVVVEIGTGMVESYQTISVASAKIYADIDVKLMGTYEEIEVYEKAKESAKVVTETEK